MNNKSAYIPFCTNSISGAAIQYRNNHYYFRKHLHTSMEIYLIRSGRCAMDIGSSTIYCDKDDFVMIFPNVVHSFYLPTEGECTFYHIHFIPDLFTRIIPKEDTSVNLIHALLFSCQSYYRQTSTRELEEIVAKIIHLYGSGTPASSINALLLCMLLQILNSCDGEESATSQPAYQENYISFVLDYIEQNYKNKILLQDIADELHISSRYLGRLFSRYMNVSLGNYINIYRINPAIFLMEHTDLTLTEIAGKVGIKDSQHFSKLFFQIIGMTPSNYRKMFLQR